MTKAEQKIGTIRYQYALMAMLVTTGNYVCRQNINIAIVDMTLPQEKNGIATEPFCQIQQNLSSIENGVEQTWKVEPEVFKFNTKLEITEDRFNWSSEEIGTLLGSFYWGYCATMLLGAVAAQRYGTYRVISYVMLTNAVITFLFPILVSTPGADLKMGIIARILLGASSGPLMPALQGAWYWWATPDEITTVIAIQTTGIVLGNCIGQGVMGVVSSSMGWQAAFFLPGAVMFGVTLLWVLMVHDKPERGDSNGKVTCFVRRKFAISHRITSDEVCYIVDKRPSKAKTARLADVPWRQIMVCLPLYAKGLMWFAMSYTIYTVTTITPLYLKRVHGLNSAQTGYIFGAVAILTAVVNMGIAVMADRAKSLLTSTQMRKSLCGSLSIIVIMCFVLMMKLGCDTHTIIFCIAILVMFSSSVSTIGLKPVTAEMAGRFSSIVFGIVNMMGNGAGFLVPQVMGKILNDKDQGNPISWTYVFGIPLALYTVCMIVFLVFGSSELQDWANAEKETKHKPDLFLNIQDSKSDRRHDFIYSTPSNQNGHVTNV